MIKVKERSFSKKCDYM